MSVSIATPLLALLLLLNGGREQAPSGQVASGAEIQRFFDSQGKTVLTFIGYSGAGYEDAEGMLAEAKKVLDGHNPAKTLVNIGATPDGIGAVYGLARSMGFTTTGIVSTQARKYEATLSPNVDRVFYVEDETWGGFVEGTDRLSPTSSAMVEVSDVIVGIGGGAVGRDEMIAARRLGTPVTFIPSDMSHRKARDKARKKGLPPPADFRGAAHEALAEGP